MHSEALLLGLAEVSIAVTGFSGVVAALSRRTWGDIERFRFINLISLSIAATIYSFLPLAVSSYDVSDAFAWIVSASLLVVFVITFQTRQLFAVKKLTTSSISIWTGRLILTASGVVVLLQLIGLTVPAVISATYISGILVTILQAVIQFVVFVLRVLVDTDQRS